MVQFASYLRRVLCKTRLIFPRINGPIDTYGSIIRENIGKSNVSKIGSSSNDDIEDGSENVALIIPCRSICPMLVDFSGVEF